MNINFSTNAGQIASPLNKLNNVMEKLGKAGRKSAGDFRAFQKQTRKINDAFSNMARDGNRSTKVFKGLSLATLSLNKAFGLLSTHRFGAWWRQGVTSAMEMIETNELFRVSLGELTTETDNVVRSMSKLTGLDSTNIRDRVANFNLLARTMGMTAKNSQTLGLNMNQLALDMGAVFNVSYAQVAEDLRSGLVGQSRVLYKYGIDVTNAQLAEEARARGIQKSVQAMTQAEKMMLRYSVILKQTKTIQGEFAHEFNFPMNQVRLFQEQFVTLSRTIGQLFLPALGAIVRVARAVTIALTQVFTMIGKLFGMDIGEALKPRDGAGLGDIKDDIDGINDGVDDTSKGLGKATKEAKKLKKQLAGFDELNIIQTKAPETPSAGGVGGGGLGDLGEVNFDLEGYDNLLDMIEDKSQAMADNIMNWMKGVWELAEPTREALSRLWDEGLSKFADFSMGTLEDFYTSFLVPIGTWALGEGLPKFFNIINDLLNSIDWGTLRSSINGIWEALSPFAINVGEGLLWFLDNVIRPLATFTINEVVPRFLELLANVINVLSGVIEVLKPLGIWLWESFLQPLAEWTGEKILEALDFLNEKLKVFGDWVRDNGAIIEVLVITLGSMALSLGLVKTATVLWTAISWLATYGTTALGLAFLALTSPMVLVVAGIGAVIAIGILLYRNWDKIKEYAGNLWEGIKNSFNNIGKKVKEVWDNVKRWGVETWQKIVDTFKGVGTWFSEKFTNAWNGITGAFSSVKTWAKGKWEDIKDIFKKVPEWFKTKFTEAWTNVKNVFSTGGKIFTGIKDGIANTFKTIVNGIIGGINKVIRVPFNAINGMLNKIRNIGILGIKPFSGLWGHNPLSVPQIPKLADGGVLNMGQLFIAREAGAELVGNFGGKTAVMNNDDIIYSVTKGVYEAVRMAMSGSNGNGQPIQLQVNVLGDTVMDRVIDGTNRQSLIDGKVVFNV